MDTVNWDKPPAVLGEAETWAMLKPRTAWQKVDAWDLWYILGLMSEATWRQRSRRLDPLGQPDDNPLRTPRVQAQPLKERVGALGQVVALHYFTQPLEGVAIALYRVMGKSDLGTHYVAVIEQDLTRILPIMDEQPARKAFWKIIQAVYTSQRRAAKASCADRGKRRHWWNWWRREES